MGAYAAGIALATVLLAACSPGSSPTPGGALVPRGAGDKPAATATGGGGSSSDSASCVEERKKTAGQLLLCGTGTIDGAAKVQGSFFAPTGPFTMGQTPATCAE